MAGEESAAQQDASRFSIKGFIGEVRAELRKVTWPTKRELSVYTGVVFVTVCCVCLLIWVYDTVFARLLEFILR